VNTLRYTIRQALCDSTVIYVVRDARAGVVFVHLDPREAERQALKLNNTHRLLELAAN